MRVRVRVRMHVRASARKCAYVLVGVLLRSIASSAYRRRAAPGRAVRLLGWPCLALPCLGLPYLASPRLISPRLASPRLDLTGLDSTRRVVRAVCAVCAVRIHVKHGCVCVN